MPRLTVKSSTIFISVGNKTKVYRSVAEVPPPLRKKLEQSTSGINSATILIADRRGRQELIQALRGLPSDIRSRVASSLEAPAEAERPSTGPRWRDCWVEILLPLALGVLVWLAFSLK
jgi:hypothetical protein